MIRRFIRRLRIRLSQKQKAGSPLRLHLGCGQDYWPGYVNIDNSESAHCDLRLDFTRIGETYSANSIAEVAMIHSLSYLRLWQARDLFADVYNLLQPKGLLIIELPDIVKCAQRLLIMENNLPDYLEGVRGIYAFGLDEIEGRKLFTPYAFGWSAWHLKLELAQAGFSNIVASDPLTHDLGKWRDIRIEATK